MEPVVTLRNISDTALWAAVYRAEESVRPDALFRDPFAARLAGDRGRAIREMLPRRSRRSWPWVARTYLFDQFVIDAVNQGADTVINLAAGLDARPYRMSLPATLNWIEVDLPDLVTYKEEVLKGEQPRCTLERIRLDLADRSARQSLFAALGARSKHALILTEGLLIYLSPEHVGEFAEDVAAPSSFTGWVIDLVSPGLLTMLRREIGGALDAAGAPLKFGPEEGPDFFLPHRWQPAEVRSVLKTAAKIRRLPWGLRLFAFLPEPPRPGKRPWSAVVRFTRRF